jgi:hypothetical protein
MFTNIRVTLQVLVGSQLIALDFDRCTNSDKDCSVYMSYYIAFRNAVTTTASLFFAMGLSLCLLRCDAM